MLRKTTSLILALLFCLMLLPAGGVSAVAAEPAWSAGNSDLNIRNGGVMLTDGDDLYFVQNGIFVQHGEKVTPLSADPARNLNLWNGYIYYTVGSELRRIPQNGGARELVNAAESSIDELYVVNGAFFFTMSGNPWKLAADGSAPEKLDGPENVTGLIPTQYGNLYLTGSNFSYTLWAGKTKLLENVKSCYADSGYLALEIENQNYMVALPALFDGFDRQTDLQPFAIHGSVSLLTAIGQDDDNTISEWNDNNELKLDFPALLRQAGLTTEDSTLMGGDTAAASVLPSVSQGQKNIVKRAHQLADYTWTPLDNIPQWGQRGTFTAGTTYTGVPYGQPVNTNGYIGYGVSLEDFDAAMRSNTSKLYTAYSTYNKIAPYYSTDCSGYVSYCWSLAGRKTTYSLTSVATKVGSQSIYSLQVGDVLNETSSHVVLVSDLSYDANGNIVGVEIMEETPVITRTTRYGQGAQQPLASIQSYYLNKGYVIYRNPDRDNVGYEQSSAVQLAGEAASADPAPKCSVVSASGGKKLTLSSNGGTIYYTTDGSAPTAKSTKYTGPITLTNGVTLRAIAVSGNYAGHKEIQYTVSVPQAAKPTASVSGTSDSGYVSAGSTVTLSAASGAKIYYTTDGSTPTNESAVYSGPIKLTQDTTIKAYASVSGMRDSDLLTVSYKVGTFYTITASADSGGSVSPTGTVKVLAGTSKSFSITPSSGYKIASLSIDGVAVGALGSYTFQNISANHTLRATFTYAAELPFTDVPQNAWFYKAVGSVYAKGLFNGTSATTFSPDMAMTRGMFVTVLSRSAGLGSTLSERVGLVTATGVNIRKGPSTDTAVVGFVPSRNTPVRVLGSSGSWYQIRFGSVTGYIRNDLMKAYNGTFTDLASGQFYTAAAQWASITGISNGTRFQANSAITREEMCLMLYRYAQFYGKTIPASQTKTVFLDDASISAYAKTAVYTLQQGGIINGQGDGTFAPRGSATRAQVAQVFMKFSSTVG